MSINSVLIHIHSILRWLVLVSIILAIVNSALRLNRSKAGNQKDCIVSRLALMAMHFQLLFGLVLYFISPKVVFAATSMKDSVLRFFLVEHIGLMIIAVILVTIGYIKSDRATDERKKHKTLLIYYSIALLLILAAIPWPFRGLGSGWF
jgi:hypothetical protein